MRKQKWSEISGSMRIVLLLTSDFLFTIARSIEAIYSAHVFPWPSSSNYPDTLQLRVLYESARARWREFSGSGWRRSG